MIATDSLRSWIRQEIQQVLQHKSAQPPLLVWCDPQRVWKDLLQAAATDNTFELWAEDVHELVLRDRFYKTPRAPRVVWLPVRQDQITYFKVFELQAEEVKQLSLPEALSQYGVDIPSDALVELNPILPAHAKEWLDYPKSAWKELTPGNAKETLINDDRVLEILATPGLNFDNLQADNRFGVFVRRVVEDFGLPEPQADKPENWRTQALATLLVTEAAVKCSQSPPKEQDRIISATPQQELALKLLTQWQKQVDQMESFETLALKADAQTTLQTWAKHLDTLPVPLSSPISEQTFFQTECDRLIQSKNFDQLVEYLNNQVSHYRAHAEGFWGLRANAKVCWSHLVKLAEIASLLHQQAQVEQAWKTPADAVQWFTSHGWQIDQAGEALFQEDLELPPKLAPVRKQLQDAYLLHTDRVNIIFSELLENTSLGALGLPFAGEAIANTVKQASAREPVAVIILDACRYDIGCRLAEMLNQGEPIQRAEVSPAIAPLPSITAIGMPFCLPGASQKIQVTLAQKTKSKPGDEENEKELSDWLVTIEGFSGNLAKADQRREWLKQTFKLKDKSLLWVEDALNADIPDATSSKTLGKLAFIFGDDLDDHDGTLKPFGLNPTIERYVSLIRRLRSGGYNTILVVTDHGFFRRNPVPDEKNFPKPADKALWKSRRAFVGQNLKNKDAIKLPVAGSDLECYVPRSINAFKTYGGLEFFHGGATLQELIIPVLKAQWSKKTKKIEVVLKPIDQITSLSQRIEVAPAATIQADLFSGADENLTSRQILVKVVEPATNKRLFRSVTPTTLNPGDEAVTIELSKVEGVEVAFGSNLDLQVIDADDEEVLDHRTVTLRVELDDWL
ncbi:MAG: hypothetical protein DCF22_18240 [Leptolyngbya sp.]|nr:MAG: hypothetical protein DCF22_18240 [Leptolyngbya sp.]